MQKTRSVHEKAWIGEVPFFMFFKILGKENCHKQVVLRSKLSCHSYKFMNLSTYISITFHLFNYLQRELLAEMSSPLEGSEEEVEKEEKRMEEEVFKDKNKELPPPSLQDASIDHTLEASLLEIIEHMGEENIVKELENLVSQNSETGTQIDASSTMKNVSELTSVQVSRNAECEQSLDDNFFLPDSDLMNSSGLPVFPCKRTKKLRSTVRHECAAKAEDYPSCCEVSDCPSFSDTDQANERFFSDHQGVSVSSTSLAEPFVNEMQRPQWALLQEHYLPQYQQSQKGASVPSSLQRDSRRKPTQTFFNPPFSHPASFSPEPHRRIKHRPDPRCRVGSTRSLCHGPVITPAWDLPHHRHSSYVQPSRYTGISESDADTLETNV